MNKFTLAALAAVAFAGTAGAQLRWNPEGAWATDNGATVLPVGEDNKTVINKLGKGEGQWRADIRYAGDVTLTEDEPYLVIQITTDGCAWNLNDYKFEFMIQRKLSEGLNEENAVVWGNNTDSYHAEYPSFNGDKLKIVDQYEAELFQLLGSKVNDGENDVYTEDIIVLDLNKVQATDEDKTPGLLFSAGDVYMPNLNAFATIVEPDEAGMGGVQQRSWMGLVCIAKDATVTSDEPKFIIHYTGTVADSSDALTVCEDYANGEGGMEVRAGEEDEPGDDPDSVASVSEDTKVYLKNGRTVVAAGAEIEVYTVDGKLVKSGFETLELNNGIYIVKAVKNGKATSVKAVVR